MSVGHGPGHQVDHDQRRPKAQPGGHQRHRQCRHDHQLLPELQVVPGLSQLIKQAGEERRVGVTGQQGGADVLGDQGPVPQAQQPYGQADRQGGGREREDLPEQCLSFITSMLAEHRHSSRTHLVIVALSGDTASDDVTPVKYGGVLEFSALIEVALLSLSQVQHRRRLNSCGYKILSRPYKHASA